LGLSLLSVSHIIVLQMPPLAKRFASLAVTAQLAPAGPQCGGFGLTCCLSNRSSTLERGLWSALSQEGEQLPLALEIIRMQGRHSLHVCGGVGSPL
jgi:hypothetical protein